MCNSVHPLSKFPKKSYGIGYKLIDIDKYGFYPSFHMYSQKYCLSLCNWINWDNTFLDDENSVGFCVFKSPGDGFTIKSGLIHDFPPALRTINLYTIQYADAFAEHNEIMYSSYVPILLVKSFRIITPFKW